MFIDRSEVCALSGPQPNGRRAPDPHPDGRIEPRLIEVRVHLDTADLYTARYLVSRPGDEDRAIAHARSAALACLPAAAAEPRISVANAWAA